MILPTCSFPETFNFLTSSLIATPVEHLAHLHFVTASPNVLGKSLKHCECMLQVETDALSQACHGETMEAAIESCKAWAKKPKAKFSQKNAYHDDQKVCVCVWIIINKKNISSALWSWQSSLHTSTYFQLVFWCGFLAALVVWKVWVQTCLLPLLSSIILFDTYLRLFFSWESNPYLQRNTQTHNNSNMYPPGN